MFWESQYILGSQNKQKTHWKLRVPETRSLIATHIYMAFQSKVEEKVG